MGAAQDHGLPEEIDREIRLCFLAEAEDLLEKFERQIIDYEKSPQDPANLAAIFRTAHTFKGSGLTAGFKELGGFCHKMENALDALRKGELQASDRFLDGLLACADLLKEVVGKLKLDPFSSGFESISEDTRESCLERMRGQSSASPAQRVPSSKSLPRPQPLPKQPDFGKLIAKMKTVEETVVSHKSQTAKVTSIDKAGVATPLIALTLGSQPKSERSVIESPEVAQSIYQHHGVSFETDMSSDDLRVLSKIVCLLRDHSLETGFCDAALGALRAHPDWSRVGRLCLAERIGVSQELRVVDSSQVVSSHVESSMGNPLAKGYSCFVSAHSSLFEIPAGHLRIFNDAQRVVDTYHQRQVPVQRSIRYLFGSGMTSGICYPLENDHSGFVFMNSSDRLYFHGRTEQEYQFLGAVFAILRMPFQVGRSSPSQTYFSAAQRLATPKHQKVLREEDFCSDLSEFLDADASVKIEFFCAEKLDVLVTHFHLAYICFLVCLKSGWNPASASGFGISVRFELQGHHLSMDVEITGATAAMSDIQTFSLMKQLENDVVALNGRLIARENNKYSFAWTAEHMTVIGRQVDYSH